LQRPRIPIWVGGSWPKNPAFRRAARYDGVVPVLGHLRSSLSSGQVRVVIEYVERFRTSDSPIDVAVCAQTPGENSDQDREIVAPYAAAGATWWLEGVGPWRYAPYEARRRIHRGPPA